MYFLRTLLLASRQLQVAGADRKVIGGPLSENNELVAGSITLKRLPWNMAVFTMHRGDPGGVAPVVGVPGVVDPHEVSPLGTVRAVSPRFAVVNARRVRPRKSVV